MPIAGYDLKDGTKEVVRIARIEASVTKGVKPAEHRALNQ
jgi:hypothetical protein